MELLPFDLEKVKKGAKLCDRLGREVLAWMVNPKTGIVHFLNYEGTSLTATKYGRLDHPTIPHDFDLFIAPEVKEGWANVYSQPSSLISLVAIHTTKEDANNSAQNVVKANLASARIACVFIRYFEGEGL